MSKKLKVWFLILCLPWLLAAEVYKSTGDNGVIYSDQQQEGMESVELESLPGMKPLSPGLELDRHPPASRTGAVDRPDSYIRLLSPANEEELRSNHGEILVTVQLSVAAFTQGHHVELVLDGQRLSVPYEQTQISLQNIDRGEHRLQALWVDGHGKVLASSAEIRFYLLRHSVLFSH